MNTFDIFYFCLLTVFFVFGAFKGFLASLIGPLCLAVCSILGVLEYDLNYNILSSVAVTITGALITSALLHSLFFIGKRRVHEQHRHYASLASRLAGGLISAGWNGFFAGLLAITITLLPNNFLGMEPAQKSIAASQSYPLLFRHVIKPFPLMENIFMTLSVFQKTGPLDLYRDTPQHQAVFLNPKIRRLLADQSLMQKIYSSDILFLLNNAQIQDVLKDPGLMRNVSNLVIRIYKDKSGTKERPAIF